MSSTVKIVTLVHMSLPRIGAASQGAFVMHKNGYEGTRVVEDAEFETIRKEVAKVARENGEAAANLQYLEQINSHHSNPKKKLEFQLVVPGTSLVGRTDPYAICQMETALDVDGRYFKVEEIKV